MKFKLGEFPSEAFTIELLRVSTYELLVDFVSTNELLRDLVSSGGMSRTRMGQEAPLEIAKQ